MFSTLLIMAMARMDKTKRKRSLLYRVLWYLNLVMVGLLLLSYFSAYIDPRVFWPMAFLGLAYPVLLAVNGVYALSWAIARKWVFFVPTIAILLGWNNMQKLISFDPGATEVEERIELKVMSYNVRNFNRYDQEEGVPKRQKMLDLIKAEKPDILCLQEFYTATNNKHRNIQRVKKLGYQYHYFKSMLTLKNRDFWGIAIYSKYPLKAIDHIKFASASKNNNGCVIVDATVQGKKVRIFNTHFQSIAFDPDDYAYAEQEGDHQLTDVKAARPILAKLKRAFQSRASQVEQIKAAIDKSPHPVVLVGDFNDTPHSYTYHQLANDLTDTFMEEGTGFGGTYVGPFPSFRIDFILTSPEITTLDYTTIHKAYSDHYPIVCEIALP